MNSWTSSQCFWSDISDSQQRIFPIGFIFLKLPPPPRAALLVSRKNSRSSNHWSELPGNIQLGDVGVWFTRRAYLETPGCARNQHLWQSAHNSPTLQAEMKREGDEHPHLDANHGLQACGLEKKEQQQKGICFLVSGWWFSFKFSDFRDQRDYSGFSMVLVDFCLTGADRDEHFWVRNCNFP